VLACLRISDRKGVRFREKVAIVAHYLYDCIYSDLRVSKQTNKSTIEKNKGIQWMMTI